MDFGNIDDAMRLRQQGQDLRSIRNEVRDDLFRIHTKSGTLPNQVIASTKAAILADIDAAADSIRAQLVAMGVDPATIP